MEDKKGGRGRERERKKGEGMYPWKREERVMGEKRRRRRKKSDVVFFFLSVTKHWCKMVGPTAASNRAARPTFIET